VTSLSTIPFRHGAFSVSAKAIAVTAPSTDFVEVMTDQGGRLCVALVDVRAPAHPRLDVLRGRLRESLLDGAALHAVAERVAGALDPQQDACVTASILRLSHYEGCAEVLNVGMPSIACVLPSGRVVDYEARSKAFDATSRGVYPYTAVSLPWDSVWLLASDGLTRACNAASGRQLVEALGAKERGLALASAAPRALHELMQATAAGGEFREDATLLVVGAAAAGAPEIV
jgi:serine phosphatase RsbU (regulator of sigma subunit)